MGAQAQRSTGQSQVSTCFPSPSCLVDAIESVQAGIDNLDDELCRNVGISPIFDEDSSLHLLSDKSAVPKRWDI